MSPHNAFVEYAEVGFLGEVIPILPPGAKLTPNSEIDPSQLGKIPGSYSLRHDAWCGLTYWTTREFTIDDCRKWDRWPGCNVGIRARLFPAVDLDCSHVAFRDACAAALRQRIGDGPQRLRNNCPRLLIPMRLRVGVEPISKLALRVKLPDADESQLVEILGSGQQWVASGVHPSGQAYDWEHGLGLLALGADNLPEVDAATLLDYFNHVETVIVPQFNGEIVSSSRKRGVWDGNDARPIGDSALMAPDRDKAISALNAIPCDKLDYDAWLAVMHAFRAAVPDGFEAFYQWSKSYPGNTEEVVRGKWESIGASSIGWDRLLAEAVDNGFSYPDDFDSDPLPPDPEQSRHKRPGAGKDDKRTLIYTRPEQTPEVVTEAENSMLATDVDLYQRGSFLVRPAWEDYRLPGGEIVKAKRLVQVTTYHIMEQMGRSAVFLKYRKTAKTWAPFSPTFELAQMYLGREGMWKLRPLAGVVSAPTLRADGSILQTPGYDPQTQIIYNPEGVEYPVIPENPTKDDALRALAVLAEPIAKFPFIDETARAAMLTAMLTACIRRSLPAAPAFALDAPTQGTGKGKLQSILAALAEGHKATPISAADGEAELEKRIDSELLCGAPILSIDNVVVPLGNDKLATILTEPIVACRVLGKSKTPRTPTGALVTITGNNLVILSELGRRTIRIRIDSAMEKPWDRQFDFDPVELVLRDRARYVTAALIILRAHHVAGRPAPGGAFGSFETWYAWIVGALAWLGCENPKQTVEVTTAEDPALMAHAAVIDAWAAVFGDEPVTVKELCLGRRQGDEFAELGLDHQRLRETLADATKAKGGTLDNIVVGSWLGQYKDRPSGSRCIARATMHKGNNRWQIRSVIMIGV